MEKAVWKAAVNRKVNNCVYNWISDRKTGRLATANKVKSVTSHEVINNNKRTDWFIEKKYTPKGYFTPPYEPAHSLEKRLAEKPHDCEVEAVVYEHGTHFVFTEGMMKLLLPIGSALAVRLAFKAARAYPKECRATRMDIDRRITRTIAEWRKECV